MPMLNPPHPGEVLREECLVPLGLSVTVAARALGVTRQALNNLVNERSGLSPEMAIRLEKAFGTPADVWVRLQTAYDLAQVRKRAASITVARYRAPAKLKAARRKAA